MLAVISSEPHLDDNLRDFFRKESTCCAGESIGCSSGTDCETDELAKTGNGKFLAINFGSGMTRLKQS